MKNAMIMSVTTAALLLALTGTASAAADGKAIYDKACASCHNKGVAKAPKLGDKSALKGDSATLTASVIKGKGIMQPRGGAQLSDEEVKASVDYMLAQAK